ncbi:TIGR01841 family phasin [Paraburkholderia sp. LEh10]|jgi:phasin family protein|uniref:TIGR01841 family phasin n=1 Tax=Paraburkholderia sp. LEh10 TaxID=2821353 RepID=UPI001AE3F756|nr:TIGR01841 family phasin [Paraburkholderia sp. LEh10]MBP0596043.1 TIGR01841 family phasin [Paraburkholderia sp. LEh10]
MSQSAIALPDDVKARLPERAAWAAAEMNDLAGLCIETAERIAELNVRAFHTTIDEQRAIALEAASECSPFGAWRLQASYAMAGTAKAVAYWRHVNEIVLGAVVDAVNGAESRLNSNFMALNRALEDSASGVGSSILTGDPAHAVQGVREAVRIVGTDPKVVSPPRS